VFQNLKLLKQRTTLRENTGAKYVLTLMLTDVGGYIINFVIVGKERMSDEKSKWFLFCDSIISYFRYEVLLLFVNWKVSGFWKFPDTIFLINTQN